MPQLLALARRGSLLEQAAAALPTSDVPVFAGIPGGMGRLAEALAGAARRPHAATVRALSRASGAAGSR